MLLVLYLKGLLSPFPFSSKEDQLLHAKSGEIRENKSELHAAIYLHSCSLKKVR
jgi:hypothetical protein